MRFLFFTDTHIQGTAPVNRKDNFLETLKNKFYEIISLSHELDVDYILHGGDWFDKPDISTDVMHEFTDIIKGFCRNIYTIAGNHDIYENNPETIGSTISILIKNIGTIKLLNSDDIIILEKEGIKVQLTGKPFKYNIDSEDFREYYLVKKRNDVRYAINLIHGMLLSRPIIEGIKYTLIDDIIDTQADITICGHYHSGFGIKVVNSKYFINPGSIVRINNYKTEVNRKPKVVLIDLNNQIEIMEIVLKSAQPGDEVLDISKLMCL